MGTHRATAPARGPSGTVRAHNPDRGYQSDADLRPATSANGPGRLRGPPQRTATPPQPPAPSAPARPPRRRHLPGADQAPARPRRPHQRIRASRIEAQVQDQRPSSGTPQVAQQKDLGVLPRRRTPGQPQPRGYLDGEKEHEAQAHETRSSTTGMPYCKSAAP